MINNVPSRLNAEFPEIFQNYLNQVSRIVILLLDQDKNILDCNNGFLWELGLNDKPCGTNIANFLKDGEVNNLPFPEFIPLKPPLRGAAQGLVGHGKSVIQFLDHNQGNHLLNCSLFNLGSHYLIFGEK